MASEKEHADSNGNIGIMYENGELVEKDIEKAARYYDKAVK